MPSNWQDYYEQWDALAPYDISTNNAYRKVDPEKWIHGDTFEELAQAMIDYANEQPWDHDYTVESIVASIERYNELVAKGPTRISASAPNTSHPIEAPCYAVPAVRTTSTRCSTARGRRQLPVPRCRQEAHRGPVRRRQRLRSLLRRRQLSDGHRGPLGRPRHHHGLCDRQIRSQPLASGTTARLPSRCRRPPAAAPLFVSAPGRDREARQRLRLPFW